MKRKASNLHSHELLGLEVEVMDKDNKVIAKGEVFDETKESLVLKINSERKTYLKRAHFFCFNLEGTKVLLSGSRIVGRPEERIKRL